MVFPGVYRITSTMPGSVYSCVWFLPQQILPLDTSMYQLEHLYLDLGDSIELAFEDRYRTLIVMSGKVSTAHVVCYRLKDQSNS